MDENHSTIPTPSNPEEKAMEAPTTFTLDYIYQMMKYLPLTQVLEIAQDIE